MAAPTDAQQLRKRHALPDGRLGGMLIHDLMNALDVKVSKGGRESLSPPERMVHAVGKLDDQAGSDPGFEGYFGSRHGNEWRLALQGLEELGAAGYLQLARQAQALLGGAISDSPVERRTAIKKLDRKHKRALEQLSAVWWQHNIQNSFDEEDIDAASDAEPGEIKISFEGPDGKKVEVDPAKSLIPGIAGVMKQFKDLMTDAPKTPPRERGLDMRVLDYFDAHIDAFDLPMTERDAARFEAVELATAAIAKAGSPAKALLDFVATPSPWVYGRSCGDSDERRRFPVHHLVAKGAGATELKVLRKRLDATAQGPEAFYAEINGALLMRQSIEIGDLAYPRRLDNATLADYLSQASCMTVPGSAGFAIYPIEAWEESTRSLLDWYEALMSSDPEADADRDYPWLAHATSIGQVMNSADHFVYVSGGDLAGKVLFTDHETLDFDVFADSFDEFIGLIAGAPSWFLQRVLSDWRFEDDADQYVPEAWMEEKVLSKD
jgi:hypothetical protein